MINQQWWQIATLPIPNQWWRNQFTKSIVENSPWKPPQLNIYNNERLTLSQQHWVRNDMTMQQWSTITHVLWAFNQQWPYGCITSSTEPWVEPWSNHPSINETSHIPLTHQLSIKFSINWTWTHHHEALFSIIKHLIKHITEPLTKHQWIIKYG